MESVLEAIEGSDIVEKIRVRNVKSGEQRCIPVSGVFIFIGTLPHTEFLEEGLLQTKDCLLYTSASG